LEARSQVARGRALLALGRLDDASVAIEGGITAARDQDLPFELALLLRLRSQWRRQRASGDDADAAAVDEAAEADEVEADRLLTDLGAKV
jgi:hypothetical protein